MFLFKILKFMLCIISSIGFSKKENTFNFSGKTGNDVNLL